VEGGGVIAEGEKGQSEDETRINQPNPHLTGVSEPSHFSRGHQLIK